MYYTNKSIRLHSKALIYLELIQKANNRYEDKRSKLTLWEAAFWDHPVRLMNKKEDINNYMLRMGTLANWLVLRMQNIFMELNQENDKQLRKVLSTNETQIIEL